MIQGPYLSLSRASLTSGGESSAGSSAMAMQSTSHTSDRYTGWSNSSEARTGSAEATGLPASSPGFCTWPMMPMSSARTSLSLRVASLRSNSKAGPICSGPCRRALATSAGDALAWSCWRTSVSRAWKSMDNRATRLLTNSMRDNTYDYNKTLVLLPFCVKFKCLACSTAVLSARHVLDLSRTMMRLMRTSEASTGRSSQYGDEDGDDDDEDKDTSPS